ncbi:peptidoglycan/xylan/chitin deacetylase (PgdA/CDA1 family) [Streptomyces aurantiacus]|uniref:polysaccharide deacetylase family protein n=1 Tax=Streptomyces aurantiacus TaxID=47760 RepID=UPI00278E63C5|nr:polysaccharide deacetylase family protein [Streptomyces aurantiacus]MDQ0775804.1 peptidoglycan/xylan/chitin deacetylase (PgdA/CDA1 family) [Streptomyces aurantiacus]
MRDEEADRRRVTLTFDNGPTPGVTDKVLDVLAAHRAPATFFVVGTQLRQPGGLALARRAAAEGHRIGHHTATHLLQLGAAEDPDAAVAAEIAAVEPDIDALAGTGEAEGERLFRPNAAGGVLDQRVFSPQAVRYLQQHRYTCVLWNCLPRDWENTESWVDLALADIARSDWSVVVLHDLDTGAMDRLPAFLDELAATDAEIVPEFPDSCLPIKQGRLLQSLSHLTSGDG